MKRCIVCQEEKPDEEFSRSRSDCRACHRARARELNPRINAISRIAYKRVGGVKDFYALPTDLRRRVRQAATEIYEARIDIAQVFGPADAAFRRKHRKGFVYGVTHPAFPSWVKVGMTTDPERRLGDYQTGAPHRDYDMPVSAFFEDRFEAERRVHEYLEANYHRQGEWFRAPLEAVENALAFAA